MTVTIEKCENGFLVTGDRLRDNPRSAAEYAGKIKLVFATLAEALEFLKTTLG